MEKKMETTIMEYVGSYWDNGKEDGQYQYSPGRLPKVRVLVRLDF